MSQENINKLPQKLRDIINNLVQEEGENLFTYAGYFVEDSLQELTDNIEKIINDLEIPKKIKKRIFQITIELTQNVYRHTTTCPKDLQNLFGTKFGFYFLNKISNFAYKVVTGNFITTKQKQYLNQYLNFIKELSKDPKRLKNKYFEVLNEERPKISNSGGLGFLDIARKTNGNFKFRFIDYNSDNIFIFSAYINETKS